MEKAELRIIKFDSSDVIATSVPVPPNPYANEDTTNLSLFYFYGLGSDKTAPTGEAFRINNGGQDVTEQFNNKTFIRYGTDLLDLILIGTSEVPLVLGTEQLPSYLLPFFVEDGTYFKMTDNVFWKDILRTE